MRVDVDARQVAKLAKGLERAKKSAFPYATREYVNSAAFTARTEFVKRADASMVLRSAWTKRSIQVDKARTLSVAQQQATVGSVAGYMLTQEEGATLPRKGKHGVPIPAAAPGRRQGRKGKVATANRLASIQLIGKGVSGIRQRRNAVAIAMAAKRGGGVVYLNLGKSRGLYRVSGTKRGTRVRKLWDLSKSKVRVPRNPMLEEALAVTRPQLPALAVKALVFQLHRHKLLGY